MKRFLIGLAIGLLGLAIGGDAWAHGGHRGGRSGGVRRTAGVFHFQRGCRHHRSVPVPISSPCVSPAPEVAWQNERILQIKNDTGQKLTVWVQYRTQAGGMEFSWLPANPEESDQAVAYELNPGEETCLETDGGLLSASRVRIWAESEDGQTWDQHKGEDLWLVTEDHGDQGRFYYGEEMETFTFTFSRE
jgi:hypothetical protein